MRIGVAKFALSLTAMLMAAPCARADHQPSYVVPGRPDVPVIINFFDASWGVVEGDWGLYRPGAVAPTVIPAPYVMPRTQAKPYYPSLGGIPYKGRLEIEPPANRQLPPPAPSYHRSWTSESQNLPVTEYPPMPPMIVAPTFEHRRP
ncbi:MAG TPA: hypothetical protein VJL90_01490 [Pseudorhodoplanes sp.]|nr:hypothetical protein [Pseudorhodoplanes sp.]